LLKICFCFCFSKNKSKKNQATFSEATRRGYVGKPNCVAGKKTSKKKKLEKQKLAKKSISKAKKNQTTSGCLVFFCFSKKKPNLKP
jgi:hypothetical protein